MNGLSFLPKWYVEEKKTRKCKFLKAAICLIFILNLLCLDFIWWTKDKIKTIDSEIKSHNLNIEKNFKNKTFNKNGSLNSFQLIVEELPNDIKAKKIHIEDKRISIKLDLKEEDKCLNFIKELEKKGRIDLKNVSIDISNTQNEDMDIEMEVKN